MRSFIAVLTLFGLTIGPARSNGAPIPARFESTGSDRSAIGALLATYTKAVSSKDRILFETLLLDKDIPFSGVSAALKAGTSAQATRDYSSFSKGVFDGPAFTQSFQNVHIAQDGALAQVSLVFINQSSSGSSWGWKTLQLLRIGGEWKIASEFYTGHPG